MAKNHWFPFRVRCISGPPVPIRFLVEPLARAGVASIGVPRRTIWPRPPEPGVDLLDECGGQVVALEEVAEAQDGGGIRGAGGAGVDSRKRPAERDLAPAFPGGLIAEREPLLKEEVPQ